MHSFVNRFRRIITYVVHYTPRRDIDSVQRSPKEGDHDSANRKSSCLVSKIIFMEKNYFSSAED